MTSYEQGSLMFFIFFLYAVIAIGIAFYIFYSYALYRTAQNNNIKNPGLAYIPLIQWYTLGQIVKEESGIKRLPEILVGGQMLLIFAAFITGGEASGPSVLVSFLSFGFSIFFCYVYYMLFKMYSPEHATVLTVVAFFFGSLVPAIFMFSKRHDEPLKNLEKEVLTYSKQEDTQKKED